jgi:hypothetical protein
MLAGLVSIGVWALRAATSSRPVASQHRSTADTMAGAKVESGRGEWVGKNPLARKARVSTPGTSPGPDCGSSGTI